MVELFDKFDNIAKGDVYDLKAKITTGPGIFSDTKTTETHQAISEGFTTFQVESARSGEMNLKFNIPGLESSLVSLEAIDYAKVVASVDDPNNIFVGGQSHRVDMKIVDADDKTISGFNTSAAVSAPELAGEMNTNLVSFKDGVMTTPLEFTPYFVAQDETKLNIKILGIDDVTGNVFVIHPEKPLRVSLYDITTKLEAKE